MVLMVIKVMTDRDGEWCWNGDGGGGDNDKGVDDAMMTR